MDDLRGAPALGPAPPASSPAVRATMQANRSRDTLPELALRSRLHALGYRYRVNLRISVADVTVRPDIVFTRARLAVFVDGCFWHSCPEHGQQPKSNSEWWEAKLERNRVRDRRANAALAAAGWRLVRVWEHDGADTSAARVAAVLGAPRHDERNAIESRPLL